MAAAFSIPPTGSSFALVSGGGSKEFWIVNGNEAAHTRTYRTMNTAQTIHIFSGPRGVIGTLKAANSNDADILFTSVSPVEMQAKMLRYAGIGFMAMGGLLCLTLIGIPVGIVFLAGGWFLRKKVKRQHVLINTTYEQFCQEQGIGLKAA